MSGVGVVGSTPELQVLPPQQQRARVRNKEVWTRPGDDSSSAEVRLPDSGTFRSPILS